MKKKTEFIRQAICRKMVFTGMIAAAALSVTACGGANWLGETSTDTVASTAAVSSDAAGSSGSVAESTEEEQTKKAESSSDLLDAVFGSDSSSFKESEAEALSEPETYDSTEAYAGTVAADSVNEPASPYFGVMHAKITGVQDDSANGTKLYTLQDVSDPANAWAISETDIGDIEADMTPGASVTFLFHGDIVGDSENVRFIAAVPDGAYTIRRAEGETTQNMMSTFAVRTGNGSELVFLKDNCEIEEGAMQNDSGDAVVVYYAESADGVNYPLKVYKAQSETK